MPVSDGTRDRKRWSGMLADRSSASSGGSRTAVDLYQDGMRNVRPYITTAAARVAARCRRHRPATRSIHTPNSNASEVAGSEGASSERIMLLSFKGALLT